MSHILIRLLLAATLFLGLAPASQASFEGSRRDYPHNAAQRVLPFPDGKYRAALRDGRARVVTVWHTTSREYIVTGLEDQNIERIGFYKAGRSYVMYVIDRGNSVRMGYFLASATRRGLAVYDTGWPAAKLLGRIDKATGAPDWVTDMPFKSADANKQFLNRLSQRGDRRLFQLILTAKHLP